MVSSTFGTVRVSVSRSIFRRLNRTWRTRIATSSIEKDRRIMLIRDPSTPCGFANLTSGVLDMNNASFRALLLGALLTCWILPAFGQTTNATLSGVVRDAQGAAVPHASVTATHIETGQNRQTFSGDTGNYAIPELPIGQYKVTASAPGFKTTVVSSVTLQVNQSAELNLTLEVGVVSDQITISSTVPLLATESSSVGTVVENRAIES